MDKVLTDTDIATLDNQSRNVLTDEDIAKFDVGNKYARGERSLIGNIFERPGAAVRSTLMGKGYIQGANFPEEVPKFQDVALDNYYNKLPSFPGKSILGMVPSALGLGADIVTNPADLLMMLAGKTPIGGGKNLGGIISKSVPSQAIGRFANMPLDQTGPGRAIKQVGQSGIFKQGRDFVYEKLAKPAADMISQYIKNNPDLVQKAFKLKDETISLIKQYGYDKVADVNGAEQIAKKAFNTALAQKTKFPNDTIDIQNTLKKIKNIYSSLKGSDRNALGRIIERLTPMQPAKEGFYKNIVPTSKQIIRQMKGENLIDISKEVRISKEAFANLRDEVSNLYSKGYSGDVKGIINSLYNDAEKSGLKGMQQARGLWKDFEDFKGVKTNLNNLEKVDTFQIQKDLTSVIKNPNNYKPMIEKYSPRMGVDKAQQLFNQALSVRHGKQVIKGAIVAGILGTGGHKVISILK